MHKKCFWVYFLKSGAKDERHEDPKLRFTFQKVVRIESAPFLMFPNLYSIY